MNTIWIQYEYNMNTIWIQYEYIAHLVHWNLGFGFAENWNISHLSPKTRASCRFDRDRGPRSSSSCKLRPARPGKMEIWWRLWGKMKQMKMAAAKSKPKKNNRSNICNDISRLSTYQKDLLVSPREDPAGFHSFEGWSTNSQLMSSYTNMKQGSYQADLFSDNACPRHEQMAAHAGI